MANFTAQETDSTAHIDTSDAISAISTQTWTDQGFTTTFTTEANRINNSSGAGILPDCHIAFEDPGAQTDCIGGSSNPIGDNRIDLL